jgi:hypothetical protein
LGPLFNVFLILAGPEVSGRKNFKIRTRSALPPDGYYCRYILVFLFV